MIKVDSSFIKLNDEPVIVKQAKTPDLLDAAGDFSYQFTIPNTAEIRSIIGVKSIYTESFNVNAELVTDDGIALYVGILNVEGIQKYVINCSFLAGNSDWFNLLADKMVYDIPISYLAQYKEPILHRFAGADGLPVTPNANLVANWDNTEGIVFPFVDLGRLKYWSTTFTRSEDFMPWTFIKHIMAAIFQSNGLLFEGDLFKDGLYNQLIVGTAFTNNTTLPYFEGMSMNVASSANQTINTTPAVMTFDLTTFPWYVGSFNPWNGTDTYTVPLGFYGYLSVDFDFSTSVDYTIELMINGVSESTIEGTGAEVSAYFRQVTPGIYRPTTYLFTEGDTVQIMVSIASGSASLLDGSSIKLEVKELREYYPQFLVGEMTQGDFIRSVFTMFNVVSSYDPISHTVTCSLFKNLPNQTVDQTSNLSDYEIDTIEVLQDLGKQIVFRHQEGITEEARDYNKVTDIPFGAGVIESENRLLTQRKEVETYFTAGMDYFNERFRASLIDIGGINVEFVGDVEDFDTVTDDGSGNAVFRTVDRDGNPKDHNLTNDDLVMITGTANGEYLGMGLINVGSLFGLFPDQFIVRRLDFVSDTTGRWQRVRQTLPSNSENVFLAVYVPKSPVSNFSKLSAINYGSTAYNEMPWAYFLKQTYGVPFDNLILSPAFGQSEIYTMHTILDAYWGLYREAMRNPVKLKARMHFTESEYLNIRFDRAVTINTEEFSGMFFKQKLSGYVGSHKGCDDEMIKIS